MSLTKDELAIQAARARITGARDGTGTGETGTKAYWKQRAERAEAECRRLEAECRRLEGHLSGTGTKRACSNCTGMGVIMLGDTPQICPECGKEEVEP